MGTMELSVTVLGLAELPGAQIKVLPVMVKKPVSFFEALKLVVKNKLRL